MQTTIPAENRGRADWKSLGKETRKPHTVLLQLWKCQVDLEAVELIKLGHPTPTPTWPSPPNCGPKEQFSSTVSQTNISAWKDGA